MDAARFWSRLAHERLLARIFGLSHAKIVPQVFSTPTAMPNKRVQLDEATWQALEAVVQDSGESFQHLADEAFKDLLKKRKQPVGLKAALEESVGARPSRHEVAGRETPPGPPRLRKSPVG